MLAYSHPISELDGLKNDLSHWQGRLPTLCEEMARSHIDNIPGFQRDMKRYLGLSHGISLFASATGAVGYLPLVVTACTLTD